MSGHNLPSTSNTDACPDLTSGAESSLAAIGSPHSEVLKKYMTASSSELALKEELALLKVKLLVRFLETRKRNCMLHFRRSVKVVASLKTASLFSYPGTSFSKPHAILNFNFFVGVKKKTFDFFLTAICGLEKRLLYLQTLHFAFCLDFLICTIFLNLLMCACLACLFLFLLF